MIFGPLEFLVLDNTGVGKMKDNIKEGGYCAMCDTVCAEPGRCNCDPLIAKHESALNVYAKEIWNEAIEAAASAIQYESDGMVHDEIIRKLKK